MSEENELTSPLLFSKSKTLKISDRTKIRNRLKTSYYHFLNGLVKIIFRILEQLLSCANGQNATQCNKNNTILKYMTIFGLSKELLQ